VELISGDLYQSVLHLKQNEKSPYSDNTSLLHKWWEATKSPSLH